LRPRINWHFWKPCCPAEPVSLQSPHESLDRSPEPVGRRVHVALGPASSSEHRRRLAPAQQTTLADLAGRLRGVFRLHVDRLAVFDVYPERDRKSTRLNSSHVKISYAV